MTLPISETIYRCITKEEDFENSTLKAALFGTDVLTLLTTLVVGILGACSVIGMPAAAAYGLIGVGAVIPIAYALYLVAHRYDCFPEKVVFVN